MSVYTYNDFSTNYYGCTQKNEINNITYETIDIKEITSKIKQLERITASGLSNISNSIKKTGELLRDTVLASNDMAVLQFLSVMVAKISATDMERQRLGEIWNIDIPDSDDVNKLIIPTYDDFINTVIFNNHDLIHRKYWSEIHSINKLLDKLSSDQIKTGIKSTLNSSEEYEKLINKLNSFTFNCNPMYLYLNKLINDKDKNNMKDSSKVIYKTFEQLLIEGYFPGKLRDLYNKELMCLIKEITEISISQEFAFNDLQYSIQEKRQELLDFQDELINKSKTETPKDEPTKQYIK